MTRAHRRDAGVEVRLAHAAVHELDGCERPVPVDRVDDEAMGREVLLVPEASLDVRRDLGGGVDLHLLGRDDRPAALGLDPAHRRERRRVAVAHPVAVRHLEEPVACDDRPDRHRLEQHVEAGVARHGAMLRTSALRVAGSGPAIGCRDAATTPLAQGRRRCGGPRAARGVRPDPERARPARRVPGRRDGGGRGGGQGPAPPVVRRHGPRLPHHRPARVDRPGPGHAPRAAGVGLPAALRDRRRRRVRDARREDRPRGAPPRRDALQPGHPDAAAPTRPLGGGRVAARGGDPAGRPVDHRARRRRRADRRRRAARAGAVAGPARLRRRAAATRLRDRRRAAGAARRGGSAAQDDRERAGRSSACSSRSSGSRRPTPGSGWPTGCPCRSSRGTSRSRC